MICRRGKCNNIFNFLTLFSLLTALFGVVPLNANGAALDEKAINFVHSLAAESYEAAYLAFDSNVKAQLSMKGLQDIWQSLVDQVGRFEKINSLRNVELGGYQIIFVSCQFSKTPIDLKLVFNAQTEIAGFFIVPAGSEKDFQPADYVENNKFIAEEVLIGRDPWELPGTLTLPYMRRPLPALILVHGSGPNDRDETIGPNKPFRDLAEGLATRGIAVLRYDKRTKVHASAVAEIKNSLTVDEEIIEDVLTALAFLQRRPEIDPSHIYVLGHSLGGTMIPRIALKDSIAAGFIIMAGATRALEDLIVEQVSYIANLDSVLTETEETEIEKFRCQAQRVKDPKLNDSVPSDMLPLGINPAYWLDLRGYRPAIEAAKINRPILILHGERDYQVTLRDLDGWREALAYANEVEIIVLPRLNHLFIKGEGKSSPQEYMQPGHVAVEVIEAISNWINIYSP